MSAGRTCVIDVASGGGERRVILDAFCGVGWGEAARQLGLSEVGIDTDPSVCATRAAAGLLTVRADVASFPLDHLAGRVTGLIASPPCGDWSRAGKRAGLGGKTGGLVHEVMRFARALRPEWIACEQVPDVLHIWRMFAEELRAMGYSAWCGELDAASYGVPQNRWRAILLASRVRRAEPPAPTHSRTGHDDLFGAGLARWVSMEDALGLDTRGFLVETMTGSAVPSGNYMDPAAKPARTVCGARLPRWCYTGSQTTLAGGRRRYRRSTDRPAAVVDSKADEWYLAHPGRSYDNPPKRRSARQPAPTVALGHNITSWNMEGPGDNKVPLTLADMAVLQDFAPDFPFQGNKSQVSRQIGNAVPVGLARAILAAITGADADRRLA